MASVAKPGRTRFTESHARLSSQLALLADASRDGDRSALAVHSRVIASELLRHLEAEEEHLLPKFRSVNASEAARLDADHDSIRALLAKVQRQAEQGALRPESVESLASALRSHDAREEKMLYPWAESRLLGWVWSKASNRLAPQSARRKP